MSFRGTAMTVERNIAKSQHKIAELRSYFDILSRMTASELARLLEIRSGMAARCIQRSWRKLKYGAAGLGVLGDLSSIHGRSFAAAADGRGKRVLLPAQPQLQLQRSRLRLSEAVRVIRTASHKDRAELFSARASDLVSRCAVSLRQAQAGKAVPLRSSWGRMFGVRSSFTGSL